MKTIDYKEFVDKGYLQEVNRRFFHPLGLSLATTKDAEGTIELYGVLDYRDDNEGIYFDNANSDEETKMVRLEKKNFIVDEFNERFKSRESKLGFMIEPI